MLKYNSNCPETWTAIALYSHSKGKKEVALAHLERATMLKSQHAMTLFCKGLIHSSMDQYISASRAYQLARIVQIDIPTYQGNFVRLRMD